ncbi:hypothetical protein M9458_014391, partial [Cirrhinus mrigala]
GHHVLVRCRNTTAVAHINHQGGIRSSKLHALAHKLLVWSRRHFLSLRATHVLGILNRGADLLSRENPLYGEWRLHPQIVDLLWERFGQAAIDLFTSRENAHCPMFFSLRDDDAPLSMDALAHPWPNVLLYAFPPLCLISPTLAWVKEQSRTLILIAPSSSSVCTAMAPPITHRPPVSSRQGNTPSTPRQGGSLGLARERANLNTLGLLVLLLPCRMLELLLHALFM